MTYIVSLLVCDDVRVEETKKSLYIGTYNDRILVNQLPLIAPSLVFVFLIEGEFLEPPQSIVAKILQPGKPPYIASIPASELKRLFSPERATEDSWYRVTINVAFSPFEYVAEGVMSALITINNQEHLAGKIRAEMRK